MVEPGTDRKSCIGHRCGTRVNPRSDYWAGPRGNTTFEAKNTNEIQEKVCVRASRRARKCNHVPERLRRGKFTGSETLRPAETAKLLYICAFFKIKPHFAHFPANTSTAHSGRAPWFALVSGFLSWPGCGDVCVFTDFLPVCLGVRG